MKSLFYAGLVLAFALTTISAIAEGGSIHGTVTDPLGAVVSGAQVELLRQGKQVSVTTTDSEGKYRFLPLPAGRYQVRTTAPSFATQQSDAIYIGSSSNAAVDLTLKVGSVSQQVVVSATGNQPAGNADRSFRFRRHLRSIPVQARGAGNIAAGPRGPSSGEWPARNQ